MRSHSGFTLIELGIVIVIIALLAASILVGKTMIEASEMRAVTSEIHAYTNAYNLFVDKYQAIPGDMNNAEVYWDADASCPNTPTNTVPKMATCNGEGNGIIGDWTNGTTATALSEYEWFRAWQHLANAELIEGQFTGVSGATSTTANVGINVPTSKAGGKSGWSLLYMVSDGSTDTAFFSTAVYSHVLVYGTETSGSFTDSPALIPQNMKTLDEKMDDGMPLTGNIRAKKNTTNTCIDSSGSNPYLITTTTKTCQLLYLMGV